MIAHIKESIIMKNNGIHTKSILRKLDGDPVLSDGKPGKYFEKRFDRMGAKGKLLCVSFSRRNGNGVKNFISVIAFLDDGVSLGDINGIIARRSFSMYIEDEIEKKKAAKFIRDFQQKLFDIDDPYSMSDRIVKTAKKMLNK